MGSERPVRFLADAMLGRLARWLRVLGFDTVYASSLDDAAIVRLADAEDRVLLTRDRHLLRELRPKQGIEITSDTPLQQLATLVAALDLRAPDELFTRCLLCNTPLDAMDRAAAMAVLPPAARELQGPFRRCPSCGRTYWPGSHVRRMKRALATALPGWLP